MSRERSGLEQGGSGYNPATEETIPLHGGAAHMDNTENVRRERGKTVPMYINAEVRPADNDEILPMSVEEEQGDPQDRGLLLPDSTPQAGTCNSDDDSDNCIAAYNQLGCDNGSDVKNEESYISNYSQIGSHANHYSLDLVNSQLGPPTPDSLPNTTLLPPTPPYNILTLSISPGRSEKALLEKRLSIGDNGGVGSNKQHLSDTEGYVQQHNTCGLPDKETSDHCSHASNLNGYVAQSQLPISAKNKIKCARPARSDLAKQCTCGGIMDRECPSPDAKALFDGVAGYVTPNVVQGLGGRSDADSLALERAKEPPCNSATSNKDNATLPKGRNGYVRVPDTQDGGRLARIRQPRTEIC